MHSTLPCSSVGFQFNTGLSLLMLTGCGHHYIDFPSYSWDSRTRKDDLCLLQYCVDGEGMLEFNQILYRIRPGDAFLVEIPGQNHYFISPDATHWEVLYLEFSKDCLPLMWKIHQKTGPVVHLSPDSELTSRMFSIFQSALQDNLSTVFQNSKTAYCLWMDLISLILTSSEEPRTKIDDVKRYMDQNYNRDDLSLDQIAESVGMSKHYICRAFRKKYGTSPGQYLRDLRISQACRLLLSTADYTMQEIAHMVGYANNNYFGKVFKAVKGVTPDQFKLHSGQYDLVRTVCETPQSILPPDQEH